MSAIDVKQTSENELTLEWDSSAANDMIADSTLAIITEIDKSPASAKRMISCNGACTWVTLIMIPIT
jgi:hypothetical protein